MHHGVILNDPEPEHLLPLLDYMYQEPGEMPRLLTFLLLPIEFIEIQSNHSIQSFQRRFCASSLPPPSSYYLPPSYGTYMHLSYPLEKM